MNYLDLFILLPIIFGFYKGFNRGLIIELTSFISLILGFYGAIKFSTFTYNYLLKSIELAPLYLDMLSFGITFILIVCFISILGKFITLLLKMVALGFINKIMGALFGGIKFLLIISLLIMFFDKFIKPLGLVDESLLKKSYLYKPISKYTKDAYPYILNEFQKI